MVRGNVSDQGERPQRGKSEKVPDVTILPDFRDEGTTKNVFKELRPPSASTTQQVDNSVDDMNEWKNRVSMAVLFMNGGPFDKLTHLRMRWKLVHFTLKKIVLKRIPEHPEELTDEKILSLRQPNSQAQIRVPTQIRQFRKRSSKFFKSLTKCGVSFRDN